MGLSTGENEEGPSKGRKEGVVITVDCNAASAHFGKDACKKGEEKPE